MEVPTLITESRSMLNAAENDFERNDLGACHEHLRATQKHLNDFFADEAPAEAEEKDCDKMI